MTRRVLMLGGAALLVLAAVFALLLAIDVHRLDSRFQADDVAYRTHPGVRGLWQPPQILPGDLARHVLGLEDDTSFREAILLFKRIEPEQNTSAYAVPSAVARKRGTAQALLSRGADVTSGVARGQLLNAVGIMHLVSIGPPGTRQRQVVLPRAIDAFRQALIADPSSADAATNLEIALRLLKQDEAAGATQNATGGGAARGRRVGSGY
jgi:hypothetical protein